MTAEKSTPLGVQAGARQSFGSRIPELDGIRGIAILTVLLYHVFSYSMFRRSWSGIAHFVMRATDNGAHGVDLFFVLSGFLITGILLDTRADPNYFRNFYARRALRILPLYYVVLLVILLCYRDSGHYVVLSFFHLSNVAPILGITMYNGAMWSLSVEEHFYLFWPLLVHRMRFRNVVLLAAMVWISEPIIRGIAFPHVSTVFPYTWFRLDGIATGALLACFVRSSAYSRPNARSLAILLSAVGFLLEIAGSPWGIRQHQTLFGAISEYPPVDMICAAIVLWGASMSGLPATRLLRLSPLRLSGDLSYCIYLNHCMLMDGFDALTRTLHYPAVLGGFQGVVIRAGSVMATSFALALISRTILERPALSLKKFFAAPDKIAERFNAHRSPTSDEVLPAR